MNKSAQTAKGIAFLLVLSMLLPSLAAFSEHAPWDCPTPGCGRKENRGNYCGGCGHPAPWMETPESTDTPTPTPKPYSAQELLELGEKYYNGRGVARDYAEAMKWYKQAAEAGNANATYNVGYLYFNGQGVAQDYGEAMKWFKRAADMDYAWAMDFVGYMYQYGYGTAQDYAEAMKWYKLAADGGNDTAMFNVGNFYYRGYGVNQDYGKAMSWFQRAAGAGNTTAKNFMGYMYQYGLGVAQDYSEALKWHTEAAEAGNASSMYFMGILYETGSGVAKDMDKAAEWMKKAQEQGDEGAARWLQEHAATPTPAPAATPSPKPWGNKYDDQYFADGKLKTEHIFNSSGRVERINTYNRYGYVTRYEIGEKWDHNGNILQSTWYNPTSTGKYSEYHYVYTYRADGQLTRQEWTYADGSYGGATEYERDESGRIIRLTSYNDSGDISYFNSDYQYDGEDHVIAFKRTEKLPEAAEAQVTQQWSNGVRILTRYEYANGTVEDYNYDSTYGDSLSTRIIDGNKRTDYTWTYDDNEYKRENIITGENYSHSITSYSSAGQTKETTYYEENGMISSHTEYKYSTFSFGGTRRQIGRVYTFYNDEGIIWGQSEYNENDQWIKSVDYDDNGRVEYYTLYEYDSDGLKTRETEYTAAGAVKSYTVYQYDAQNRVKKSIKYHANGNKDNIWEYRYQSDGSYQVKRTYYNEKDGSFWFETDWD